jgi:5-methylcytosine-specific restriction endonuclease McrA
MGRTLSRNPYDDAFLHGPEWPKIRRMALTREPLCRHCSLIGKVAPATQVDHITPPYGDVTLQRDLENMQSLCASHHSTKTRNQAKGNNIPHLLGRDSEWRMVFSDGSKKPSH